MSSNETNSEIRKKIKAWLVKPEHIWLLVVIAAALIIRIYYLFITHGQPLWWDEAEYMSTAKHWAYGVPYDLNNQRPPLFQLVAAGLLGMGIPESWLIFLLVVIPSTLVVVITYWLGKEMFDSKIGVIAAAGATFMWSFLFWTIRFQPDFWSIGLQLLAILFYWKAFKSGHMKHAVMAGVCAAGAFYFKISALLVPLSIFIFVLLKERFSFVKNKLHWTALGSYIVTLLPFMIWQFVTFGNPLAFAPSYASPEARSGRLLGWNALQFFYSFSGIWFFILFALGLGAFLLYFIMASDLYIKGKYKEANPELLSFIILLVNAAFYIFFIKSTIEDRWIFLIAPFVFFFSAKGMLLIYNQLSKIKKGIAVFFIVLMFALFIYGQVTHSYSLALNKKGSYLPVKESGEWIKQNSQKDESVLSVSYTQTTSYAERRVYTYSDMSLENFTRLLEDKRPSYLIVSILEPHHPQWMIQQGALSDGGLVINMPYLNSTVAISAQGQILVLDVKKAVQKGPYTFELVYPQNNINGLFAYHISYTNSTNL